MGGCDVAVYLSLLRVRGLRLRRDELASRGFLWANRTVPYRIVSYWFAQFDWDAPARTKWWRDEPSLGVCNHCEASAEVCDNTTLVETMGLTRMCEECTSPLGGGYVAYLAVAKSRWVK